MSGKKIYQIIKNRVAENSELALREKQILERRNVSAPESGYIWRKKMGPLAATAVIWCCCIPAAYYIWKREKAKRDSEPAAVELDLAVETDTDEKPADGVDWKEVKTTMFGSKVNQEDWKYFKDGKPDLAGNPGRNCTINYEKERVEILQCNSLTWYIRVVPFSEIQRDCNGELKFDEQGNPVRIPWSFRNFFTGLHEALKVKRV